MLPSCPTAILIAAGDWLINTHLAQFSPQFTPRQISQLTRNPQKLAELVRSAFTLSPTNISEVPLQVATHAQHETREKLLIIDEAVRAAPVLGIPAIEIAQLLIARGYRPMTVNGIHTMISRNYPLHQLRYYRGRIRLRADVAMMRIQIERSHASGREYTSPPPSLRGQIKARKKLLLHKPLGNIA